jgi:uncharacterized protein YjbI with pentapeptide repeats
MNTKLTENTIFDKTDYTGKNQIKGEFENCTFRNCNFYTAELSNIIFNDCNFDSCDFSLAQMNNTVLNNIRFVNCKLLGLHFSDCNELLLSVGFENCLLNLSSFYKLKLKKTNFVNCNLQDSDFTETDLTGSLFDNCNLQGAIFSYSVLEKADFRSSFNYSIDPEKNRIRKARFAGMGIAGLLDKYEIVIE